MPKSSNKSVHKKEILRDIYIVHDTGILFSIWQSCSESSGDDIDEQLQQLTEMFPDTVKLELEHCLRSAEGDVEKAVQIVLHRQDSGSAITKDKKVLTDIFCYN